MTAPTRSTAHYYAAGLLRAVIEQDTCREPFLATMRAERVDETFRDVALRLGYRVERIQPAAETEGAA